MKKISFKNFRRFVEFPTLELGKISIMVGRNNSGKSTMVKAILLVLDYLQNQQYNEFSFTNKSLEDANIITFGRAKNNKLQSTNEISFQIEIEDYVFSIFIYGENDDTSASVSRVIISDQNLNTTFEINYITEIINISKSTPKLITKFDALDDLIKEWEEIGKEIQKDDFKKISPEGLRVLDRYNSLKEKIDSLNKNLKKESDEDENGELFNLSYSLKSNLENKTEDTILQEFVSDFTFQNDAEIRKLKNYVDEIAKAKKIIESSTDSREVKENKNKIDIINKKIELLELTDQTLEEKIQELVDIDNYRHELSKSIENSIRAIKDVHLYYLGANPSKQSALFSIRDKQNNLAQAIHDFKQSKIYPEHSEYIFVKKWMKKFEVGEDFNIEFYAGEAYEFYVIDEEQNTAHLADKGMGSLQAMMLILRVATIMRKHRNNLKQITIIVEEPELNLHPALQSKLSSFFHTVNVEYGIHFIIETHSEYLIRKSQLLVAENGYTNPDGLNPNPFKIHYFDLENGPYQMNYRFDGRFTNEFGTGFYDVNNNLIFDLP
ncbi:AAA family ATPase [Flavobacterium ginsenosidimutans]|uniref:AAA family ATPase n=1 Tax=Flavobacterium ginsenosidimutans TaxID=687844 RepID=UPI000DADA580|nr:AAA family ATPase [Flavobacterium ginsenosidimutans]KAF2335380.1 AAA family ATPase [Flavobacterium ginsenosidimutans]